MYCVYLVTCKLNGKHYVGVSARPAYSRWSRHKAAARDGAEDVFARAVRKYGPDNFEVRTLAADMTPEKALWLEAEMIKALNCRAPHGYNSTTGERSPVT